MQQASSLQHLLVRLARRLLCAAIVLFSGCAAPPVTNLPSPQIIPGDPAAPSQVTASEALATAETYSRHPWRPFARNIFHGLDHARVQVDTPDASFHPPNERNGWWIPGEVNEGIPYKWGGFDDPASFDAAIAAGHAAGDVSSPAKRRADNRAVSAEAAGVDCSGFVSRCLKLPAAYDSSQLPGLCDALAPDKMQPGDLLNIPHQHVILFAGWARPDHSWIYYYETGGIPEWKPALKQSPLAALLTLGFKPLHYRGMARVELPSGKEVLTRAVRAAAVSVENPVIGAP